jgi:hypothetical protein
MFDFVRKVINLASEKDWKIQSITVGMPELALDSTEINSVKIPIPSIKEPPVTFQFKPKEQSTKRAHVESLRKRDAGRAKRVRSDVDLLFLDFYCNVCVAVLLFLLTVQAWFLYQDECSETGD